MGKALVVTLVREFHEAFGVESATAPAFVHSDTIRLRMRLIREEFEEVMDDMAALLKAGDPDAYMARMRALLKELADLRYVTDGAAVTFGLDIDRAFALVHESNMSKLWPDGSCRTRDDGKILKGPGYHEPDLSSLVPDIINVEHEEVPHEAEDQALA